MTNADRQSRWRKKQQAELERLRKLAAGLKVELTPEMVVRKFRAAQERGNRGLADGEVLRKCVAEYAECFKDYHKLVTRLDKIAESTCAIEVDEERERPQLTKMLFEELIQSYRSLIKDYNKVTTCYDRFLDRYNALGDGEDLQ